MTSSPDAELPDAVEMTAGAAEVTTPTAARRPTGDQAVDEVLGRLDAVADEPLDTQIEAGEQAHAVLRGRLADLGRE